VRSSYTRPHTRQMYCCQGGAALALTPASPAPRGGRSPCAGA
jgi:hypothetical protein